VSVPEAAEVFPPGVPPTLAGRTRHVLPQQTRGTGSAHSRLAATVARMPTAGAHAQPDDPQVGCIGFQQSIRRSKKSSVDSQGAMLPGAVLPDCFGFRSSVSAIAKAIPTKEGINKDWKGKRVFVGKGVQMGGQWCTELYILKVKNSGKAKMSFIFRGL